MEPRMENWLSDHVGEALTAAGIIVGNIVGYARLVFHSKNHSRRLSILEATVGGHVTDTSAHRNADFEKRLESLSDTLDEIKADVKTLLQHEDHK